MPPRHGTHFLSASCSVIRLSAKFELQSSRSPLALILTPQSIASRTGGTGNFAAASVYNVRLSRLHAQSNGKGNCLVVLVIGGAGYIGNNTARALRRAGHNVIIFDNLSTGYELLASGFELVRGDVLDAVELGRTWSESIPSCLRRARVRRRIGYESAKVFPQ